MRKRSLFRVTVVSVFCCACHAPKPREAPPPDAPAHRVLRAERVGADARAGTQRLRVRTTAGHGYEPGRLVALFAHADGIGELVPVGVAEVVEVSTHTFDLLALWIDPTRRDQALEVGPVPPGHHFGYRLGQIVADDRSPQRIRINMGDAHGVSVGAMYTVLGDPYADADLGGRSLGRPGVGVVQVVQADSGGHTAIAELRQGTAPVGAFVRHAGHEPVAPRPQLRILVARFHGDRGDVYREALLEALERATRGTSPPEIFVVRGQEGGTPSGSDDLEATTLGHTYRADLVVWGSASALGDNLVVRPRLTFLDARGESSRLWDPVVLAAARLGQATPDALSDRLHGLAAYLLGSLYFTDFEAKVDGSYARAASHFRVAIQVGDAVDAERAELALFECLDRIGDWAGADRVARTIEASGRARGLEARRAMGLLLRARIAVHTGELDQALADARAASDAFTALAAPRERALALREVADILLTHGQVDESLRLLREELLPIFERLGETREHAITVGKVAEILHLRGELDEALRLYREQMLPVFAATGDVRQRALTLRAISDLLFLRGELDEALRLRQHEVLPVFERLGDRREQAITLGKIADVLHTRGDFDAALKMRRDEVLPVFVTLGDLAEQAWTLGRIADIHQGRGEATVALQIRRDEVLPLYTKLGDRRGQAITRGRMALIRRGQGNHDEALKTLEQDLLPIHEALGDALQHAHALSEIAYTHFLRGAADEALRLYRDKVLPAYDRLGAVQFKAGATARIALILKSRGELDEALRLHLDEVLPVYERLGLRRHRAVAMRHIAEIRIARGELDEALRLLRDEILPADRGDIYLEASVLEQIVEVRRQRGELVEALRLLQDELLPLARTRSPAGHSDIRLEANVIEKIVDIRRTRGELAEALRLLRDELLPLRRAIGNKWQHALTLDAIAEVVATRGELDEAIRIRTREVLPMLLAMDAPDTLARCRWQTARVLLARDAPGDREAAATLLVQAQATASAHTLSFAADVAAIRAKHGL